LFSMCCQTSSADFGLIRCRIGAGWVSGRQRAITATPFSCFPLSPVDRNQEVGRPEPLNRTGKIVPRQPYEFDCH
jgi:hypothetical protein